jgi:hypothetical protein
MVEIVHGPMMAVDVVVAEMMKVVAMGEPVAETRPEAAMRTTEPASYGIGLSQRDSENNSRGNGEGFS